MTPLTETSELIRQERAADVTADEEACPVCSRAMRRSSVSLSELEEDLQNLIRANAPDAATEDFQIVCERCARLFRRAKDQIFRGAEAATQTDGSHVLSTPLRLDADERYTGKNVTIAFLDSGFYSHADLTTPNNRILAYHSLVAQDAADGNSSLFQKDAASWHGMMTSVVAAGNGGLSNGFYRGIAPDANVVLVKLARTGRITERDIERGLEWVLENREKYDVRIVNISAGGDFETSYLDDSLSQTVEKCVREGITVVCAVGNAGHLPNHPVFPPASSPACIAVGGMNDHNSIRRSKHGMYLSTSYGPTVDGLQKPEIIAPSVWIPAPILPGTPTAEEAALLEQLVKAENDEQRLREIIGSNQGVDPELDAVRELSVSTIRNLISFKWTKENVITRHYKYVDGTSFAAPIVSSVVAQMLEANPKLKPQQIKKILITTAERLPNYEVDRQGWGVIDPRKAVEMAERQKLEDGR